MRAQLAQTRYKRFAFPPTRCSEHAILTEAISVKKEHDFCIAVPYGNAEFELRSRDAFVVELEMFRESRAARRPINDSREA